MFDFVERCRKHTATGPLLGDLLETVRNLGFEHLILSGVPLGGQKLAPMVELNGWPPAGSNAMSRPSMPPSTAFAFTRQRP
ncbi:hypothetical protein NKH69_19800 [Mesorhizobium sp. M0976]|uniref:hypothetical protein n=1 Tax=Mesorhizobium sp. M0976 TaxID=2957038 RepID=UPI00333724B1